MRPLSRTPPPTDFAKTGHDGDSYKSQGPQESLSNVGCHQLAWRKRSDIDIEFFGVAVLAAKPCCQSWTECSFHQGKLHALLHTEISRPDYSPIQPYCARRNRRIASLVQESITVELGSETPLLTSTVLFIDARFIAVFLSRPTTSWPLGLAMVQKEAVEVSYPLVLGSLLGYACLIAHSWRPSYYVSSCLYRCPQPLT